MQYIVKVVNDFNQTVYFKQPPTVSSAGITYDKDEAYRFDNKENAGGFAKRMGGVVIPIK